MTTRKTTTKKTPKKKTPLTIIHQKVIKKVQGQRQRVGVLVGRLDKKGFVRLGWSRVNINGGDKLNPKYAYELALERTKAEEIVPVPPSLAGDMYDFSNRCASYFQNAKGMSKIAIAQVKEEVKPEVK